MKFQLDERVLLRTILGLLLITIAAVLRIAPHPWNLAPVGAVALFSGAIVRNRLLAFVFPIAALFAGDIFVGFHKLMPVVYASFLVSVAIGLWLRENRSVGRIGAGTLAGAIQFFLITNFGVWLAFDAYPKTTAGLVACYIAGLPFFWNTLAGDALYAALLFGGFALAERLLPQLQESPIPVR